MSYQNNRLYLVPRHRTRNCDKALKCVRIVAGAQKLIHIRHCQRAFFNLLQSTSRGRSKRATRRRDKIRSQKCERNSAFPLLSVRVYYVLQSAQWTNKTSLAQIRVRFNREFDVSNIIETYIGINKTGYLRIVCFFSSVSLS